MRNLIKKALSVTFATLLLASITPAAANAATGSQPPVVAPSNGLLVDTVDRGDVVAHLQDAQYIWGGRNYCWYGGGWRGPGYYWCGYAWRTGFGWGGPWGWHGWGGRGWYGGWRGGWRGGWHGGWRGGWHGGWRR